MKKLKHYLQNTTNLIQIFLILITTSCNSIQHVSDYPNFKSPDHAKYGFQAKGMKMLSRSINELAPKPDSISYFSTEEKIKLQKDNEATRYTGFVAEKNIRLITTKSMLPVSANNQGALTASLSVEPLITKFSFYPDTNKQKSIQASDTNIKNSMQSPGPTVINDKKNNTTEEKNNKLYTYMFFGSVLLAIVLLIFGLPFSNLFILSALVFGALRLKLFKKKNGIDKKTNTRLGCFIGLGLIAAVFITLAIVILVGLSQ